jgi:tetratricopeptide (TPR) repeat protein
MRRLLTVSCTTALLSLGNLCHAQSSQPDSQPATEPAAAEQDQKELARKLYAEGSQLYEQADYAGAVAAFEKAYAAYPAPALLFNLAQAERLLGPTHCQQALDYYERYRQTPESAADREEVEVHVAEMRGCVKANSAAAQQPVAAGSASPPPKREVPEPAPQVTTSRPIPTSAYVLGAVGAFGLATFGTLAILGKSQQNDLERSCSPACSPAQLSPMKTKFVIADIALAVSAVSLGTAGYLVLTRPEAPARADSRAAFYDGAQLSWLGSF